MGSALMNKMWKFMGIENEEQELEEGEEYYEEASGYEEEEDTPSDKGGLFGKKNKVMQMPGTQQVKMVISQPTMYEQSQDICDSLKEKKSVIVNLEYVNKDVAHRIFEFLCGAVYAVDGTIQKVSNSIFLIAPYNYDIQNELAREEIKNKVSMSWLK